MRACVRVRTQTRTASHTYARTPPHTHQKRARKLARTHARSLARSHTHTYIRTHTHVQHAHTQAHARTHANRSRPQSTFAELRRGQSSATCHNHYTSFLLVRAWSARRRTSQPAAAPASPHAARQAVIGDSQARRGQWDGCTFGRSANQARRPPDTASPSAHLAFAAHLRCGFVNLNCEFLVRIARSLSRL